MDWKKVKNHLSKEAEIQKELAKANFIDNCDKHMVVAVPLLLRVKNEKFLLTNY